MTFPAAKRPSDATGLAKLLIRSEKLTEYQAKQLMKGETKSLVFGYYVVFDKIGEGGMGVVLKARHQRMDRIVAVKVLPKEALKSSDAVDRFYREVKAAGRLSHPNIVTAHDAGEHEGTHYFVMEYVEGQDLAQLGHERGPLPVDEAVGYIVQAGRGLEYAHSQGIVHRDIKPANLLLDASGTVKILDMGLARFEQGLEDGESGPLTHSGQVMGTAGYMAPEQAEDTHRADHRADIYSLGCSLYRLLTNKAMYAGDTLVQVLLAHRDQPIPSLRDKRPDVPQELDNIYQKMVAKRPEDRYQSMGEAISSLELCLRAVPVGPGDMGVAAPQAGEKSDSDLKDFLNQFSPGGETIRQQAEVETGETPQPMAVAKRKSQPWWLYAGIGVSLVLLLALGIAFMQSRGAEDHDQLAQVQDESSRGDNASEPDLIQQESERFAAELTAMEKPDDSAEMVPEPSGEQPADEDPMESPPEPAMQPKEAAKPEIQPDETAEHEPIPAPVEPQTPEADPAEIARRGLLEKQRAVEAKYTAAMKPVEEKVAIWDFAAAWQATETLEFEEPELTARLEARRDEIRRMGLLKRRIIAAIGEANPPLKKSDLKIRGIGGEITDVGLAGITTKTIKGEVERLTWNDLGTQATGKLMDLVVDTSNGEDCIAAGLLSFVSGDRKAAERFFSHANTAGIDISPQLTAMAVASLTRANELVLQGEFKKAASMLEDLESNYSDLPWMAANRKAFDAVLVTARQGVRESEAEALYAEAVNLHEKKALFDLRDTVTRLKTDYAGCRVLSDASHKPSFSDLEKSVTNVGKKLTVRLDGKGNHETIQAAIDVAPPNSLIEIQDNGPYNERLAVNQEGVTLRGKEGCWPIITSRGPVNGFPVLVNVTAKGASFEHLVLAHTNAAGQETSCLASPRDVPPTRVRSCILHGPFGGQDTAYDLDSCIFLGASGQATSFDFKNCQWLSGGIHSSCRIKGRNSVLRFSQPMAPRELWSCVIVEGAIHTDHPGPVLVDCILTSVESSVPDIRIEHCNVHGSVPFIDRAKPGKGCVSGHPQFANPMMFDYRLVPGSPGTGMASDGGDIGVRYTPEMIEILGVALELRAQGVIKF